MKNTKKQILSVIKKPGVKTLNEISKGGYFILFIYADQLR